MVSVLGSTGDIYFANSNGITFGGNASTITASHNGLTTQTVQPVAISGSNGSFSFSTVTFGNLNGLSFYSSNGSLVGSYTVPSVTNSSWTVSAGTQSATVSQLVFSNSNGVSFGLNNGTITGSHNGLTVQTQQPINFTVTGAATISNTSGSGYDFLVSGIGDISAGISSNTIYLSHAKNTHYVTAGNGSFSYESLWGAFNSNGISFSTTASGGTSGLIASHNGITSQSVQTQNMVSILGSTGNISFANSNGITFGGNASTVTASHNGITSQTVQPVAVSGSNGSFNFSTVTFGNLNGISFYTSNGSVVASYTVPAGGSPAVSGSNGSFTFNTVTFGNLNGASFYTSNGSVVLSYSVPAAGGALSFSAGTSSGTFQSLVFSNSNSISFGLSGSTVTASYNDTDITLSAFPDPFPTIAAAALADSGTTGNTGGSTQVSGSIFIRSWQIPHPVVFDSIFAFNMHSVTSAGTGSATVGHAIGIYSLNANTALSLVSSYHWQMYVSQNSVTARTHHWFWGNASNANSSALNGNVSASFTGANGIPRRIMLSSGSNTLNAGNYYVASIFTARTSGVNVFACSNAVEGVSAIGSFNFMLGEAALSRFGGFIGAVSSTFNMSSIPGLSLPDAIATSAISLNVAPRITPLYMARSKS
jgi:hypothetical protein